MQIFCSKCLLCPSGSNPTFCYEQVYKKQPKLFVKVIFQRLLQLMTWIFDSQQDMFTEPGDINKYILNHAFCSSGLCGKKWKSGCEQMPGCLTAFTAQIEGKDTIKVTAAVGNKGKKKNKKYKKKQRYVAKAYPTFFCNEPFKSEIEAILNEDNDKQQDKTAGSPGLNEAAISGAAESSQPEVPGGPGRW